MIRLRIKREKTAAAVLCVLFAVLCTAYVLLPGRSVRQAAPDAVMQGGDPERTVFSEVTPGESVCINTADLDELQVLPGIGPVLAERIVAYRQDNGAFAAIEDIMKVEGIGQSRFEAIRELISI